MEAMRWDFDSMTITDSLPGEMNPVRSIYCLIVLDGKLILKKTF